MSSSELSRQDADKQACKHSTGPGRGSTKKLSPSQKAKPDRTLYTSLSAREVYPTSIPIRPGFCYFQPQRSSQKLKTVPDFGLESVLPELCRVGVLEPEVSSTQIVQGTRACARLSLSLSARLFFDCWGEGLGIWAQTESEVKALGFCPSIAVCSEPRGFAQGNVWLLLLSLM